MVWRLYGSNHDFEGYITPLIMILQVIFPLKNDFEGYIPPLKIPKSWFCSFEGYIPPHHDFEGYIPLMMILKVICPESWFWNLYAPNHDFEGYMPLIMNMKNEVMCFYFSSLVAVLLHENAWLYIT